MSESAKPTGVAHTRHASQPLALVIIIVSWNVRDMLAACLRSVQADLANSELSSQIWVVDNASTDNSTAMLRRNFPDVQLIASDKNLGFAGGNNAALRAVGFGDTQHISSSLDRGGVTLPKAVLLLNPDTEIHSGALQILFDFLQNNPKAGLAGARLIYGDGSFQHGAFAFPGLWQLAIELLPVPGRLVESGLNGRYPRTLYENGRPFQIGHPLGAAMCVRREAIQQVGLLDERYHMYAEEIDWSKRIVAAGWQAYCVPTATVTHHSGQSSRQIKTISFVNLWTSRYQFYCKHYNPFKIWLASQIVKMGMKRQAGSDIQAATQGKLKQGELSERLASYRQVVKIWQGIQT
jgi:GT2 family glycosyltransferase